MGTCGRQTRTQPATSCFQLNPGKDSKYHDALMLKAWPSLTSDEFTAACLRFETSASGRLDGTNWFSLKWDDAKGALYIKKQYQIEASGEKFAKEETDVENELTDLEDDVGVPCASSSKFLTQF